MFSSPFDHLFRYPSISHTLNWPAHFGDCRIVNYFVLIYSSQDPLLKVSTSSLESRAYVGRYILSGRCRPTLFAVLSKTIKISFADVKHRAMKFISPAPRFDKTYRTTHLLCPQLSYNLLQCQLKQSRSYPTFLLYRRAT